MTRHQMRQSAFILTFERIFNTGSIDEIVELAKECGNIEIDNSVITLFKGVDENKEVIDSEISKHLKKWSISRISKVSLAVLRVAMYEIMFSNDMDIDIIISEAVKIAQTFTLKDDVAFVNGVLSSVAKERK
ncbi:transcription antitermination factor NusB [Paludicola sp. MB14-C6]|uniref:transcription antitermination factor NusB n=1 Tax=Paludihabitans sp. MB14-C6 TaxID=3070656 RepID=UPI0027DDFAC5|nr:transcription antitermination factor NusB [Paludicola sp. MB14-C6]WMJ23029.1 transcription antitermination factor NusB [Paludicola sp. MB14-C6]